MSSFAILMSILTALLLGAMSPGPSFVMVSRIAIVTSRQAGLAAALGMGIGGAVFAALALLGLNALLMRVEWLYLLLKLAGGIYLVYLGIRIWRAAAAPLDMPSATQPAPLSAVRAFLMGLATQLSNPKTAVVYGSIFAALLPLHPEAWVVVALPLSTFLIEFGWYCVVALAFSASRPRALYIGWKRWIDRAAGGVMSLLGLRLVMESLRGRVV